MEKKTNYSIQTLLESRSFLYVLLLIVTICFVSTYTKIYDVKLDMNGDNIHYYALGKALAEGKGFTNTISFSETPHTHFPPGYPVFVAGVMKFFPDNINAVKIANGILLYAAILLLFFLLKKISGKTISAAVDRCIPIKIINARFAERKEGISSMNDTEYRERCKELEKIYIC